MANIQYQTVSGGGGVSYENGVFKKVETGNVRTKTEYKDVLMKAEYYKQRVIKTLAKYGQIISDKSISDRMDSIDLYQPIFRQTKIKTSKEFDTEQMNKDIASITKDLEYLYQLLEEHAVIGMDSIKSFAEAHLREMEMAAKRYAARIDIEMNSSSLGKSVFFMEGPFGWITKDNFSFVDLGRTAVNEGSTLGMLISGTNITHENVMLGAIINNKTYYITPYNYMNDVFNVPGSSVKKNYARTFESDMALTSSFDITAMDMEPSSLNNYVAYGGKNQLSIKQNSLTDIVTRSDDYSFRVAGNWEASFYIKDGTYARFTFSDDIKNKNFTGNEISDLSDSHIIQMKGTSDFAFSVVTDGTIYAEKNACSVRNGKLYYPKGTLVRDFDIIESKKGKEVAADLFLRVKSDGTNTYPEIDSIAVKELLEGDVFNDML